MSRPTDPQGNAPHLDALEPELYAEVYSQLHQQAQAYLRRERGDHTLQPTALVSEAWLRLSGDGGGTFEDRQHFLRLASRAMRHILVDHARAKHSGKRGGEWRRVNLEPGALGEDTQRIDVLALDDAMLVLTEVQPRAAQVVELHFFGGLRFEEVAENLQVSLRTVKYDWKYARAKLQVLIEGEE